MRYSPPTTKRATKFYSLNTLIRLGYVKPHAKGDPYFITEDSRQKSSNTENRATTGKSNVSKASPSLFIWTLPVPCPMSSPVPHTYQCGTDETLDTGQTTHEANGAIAPTAAASAEAEVQQSGGASDRADLPGTLPEAMDGLPAQVPMTEEQLTYYAKRAGVSYPTSSGADLYRMCAIPKAQRDSFENGLGDAVSAYYDELARIGKEPPEPATDPVESFVRSGLLSAEELFAGYERARQVAQATEFMAALKERNSKAAELLMARINGKRVNATAYIAKAF